MTPSRRFRALGFAVFAAGVGACDDGASVVGPPRPGIDAAVFDTEARPASDASADVSAALDVSAVAAVDATVDATLDGSVDAAVDAPTRSDVPGAPGLDVSVAVARVKNLLTGEAVTDDEVRAVRADATALDGLIAGWMTHPGYRAKMLRFFATAFQQNQFNATQLATPFGLLYVGNGPTSDAYLENVQESFARTALQLVDEGRPFTETMTTTRHMMTPALMALYGLLDVIVLRDGYQHVDLFQAETPVQVTLERDRDIPLASSLDPSSPDYMTFRYSSLPATDMGCLAPTVVYPSPAMVDVVASMVLYGLVPPTPGRNCVFPDQPLAEHVVQGTDFTDWRMVTVRPIRGGERRSAFYDIPALRAGHELALDVPRVGFFTTLAFIAQWPTNRSNLARVTINQTMITALGKPFDTTNDVMPLATPGLDPAHAPVGGPCYGCHVTMDPMRQYFRQALTLCGSVQHNPAFTSVLGEFAFHGVVGEGVGMADFGSRLASHPLFAPAWVQRLCTYATSARCDESSAEFRRLVAVFRDHGHDWNALVRALFASPLVTGLGAGAPVASAPLARQSHLCALLEARTGIADPCALRVGAEGVGAQAHDVAATWPSDRFSRGQPEPTLVTAPSMFARGGLETVCAALAQRLVDNGSAYNSNDPDGAVALLVGTLMNLHDDRARAIAPILRAHFDDARAAGNGPADALRSTFMVACTSAAVAAVGM